MKRCMMCGEMKPNSEFYCQKEGDGYRTKCKTCHNRQTVDCRRLHQKPRLTLTERFLSKVVKTDSCWEWIGAKTSAGYGLLQAGKHSTSGNRVPEYAHRISFQIYSGSIPDGMTIDHLCKNHGCVNPEHLEVVTLQENILRSDSPSAQSARSDTCKRGHPKTPENTYTDPAGKTECRRCRELRWQEWSRK